MLTYHFWKNKHHICLGIEQRYLATIFSRQRIIWKYVYTSVVESYLTMIKMRMSVCYYLLIIKRWVLHLNLVLCKLWVAAEIYSFCCTSEIMHLTYIFFRVRIFLNKVKLTFEWLLYCFFLSTISIYDNTILWWIFVF